MAFFGILVRPGDDDFDGVVTGPGIVDTEIYGRPDNVGVIDVVFAGRLAIDQYLDDSVVGCHGQVSEATVAAGSAYQLLLARFYNNGTFTQ